MRNLGFPSGTWRRADGQARGSRAQGLALFSLSPRWRRSGVVRSTQDTALGREGEDVSLGVVARGGKESTGWTSALVIAERAQLGVELAEGWL